MSLIESVFMSLINFNKLKCPKTERVKEHTTAGCNESSGLGLRGVHFNANELRGCCHNTCKNCNKVLFIITTDHSRKLKVRSNRWYRNKEKLKSRFSLFH